MPPRRAHSRDLPYLGAIERSAASAFRAVGLAWIADGPTMDPARLAAILRTGALWVAVGDNDEPVGFLAAEALDGLFHIAELSVAATHQRRGLGAALVEAAIVHACCTRHRLVTLTTYLDVPWNGPFYRRFGFTEVDAAALGPAHVAKQRAETEAGHDPARRCVMARPA